MNKIIAFSIILVILTGGCATTNVLPAFKEEQKIVNYADSLSTIWITKSSKSRDINLVFLKQFKDSIDIYLNNDKVKSFYKNDFHYDENGKEYIIHDESPNVEAKTIFLKKKSKNQIIIALKNKNKKVSFVINKLYDVYLVSHYNDSWFLVGTKSRLEKKKLN
ncbi:hypothetical protein [Flavobacterium sp. MDT1-60]|uniref:hypothetical protein n=1 Tax=Flavobacterium sp. MDT1-60 TaxID=1979344 RepID=UPI0017858B39|nr:hypothetical protein [Flavobacterium sp. MDT1-60]QOG01405.1 hypothetical protein IHE43_16545 [Flavobacterium sp. MDT1-60]